MNNRSQHICGTDIAAIVGCNPWKGRMDVYLEKTGQGEPLPDNDRMYFGRMIEPVIANRYAADHGVSLTEPGFMVHDKHPWWGGTPDRYVFGLNAGHDADIGLEIKTAGLRQADRWGDPGTDSVPEHYLMQCCWYAPLMHVERMDVAVLIGGQDYREYTIARDHELEAMLVAAGEKFWRDHILKREPPALDASDSTRRYLALKFPVNNGTIIAATPEINEIVAMLKQARSSRDKYEQVEATLQARIEKSIGDNDGIDTSIGRLTWKRSKDSQRLDVKSLQADPEAASLVARHMKIVPGTRRFLAPRDWGKEE
jgi:putative phage-type endonuclease